MKITKGLKKQIFNNTYNNSTIWDYYRECNYTDVRNIVSDDCDLSKYFTEVEGYFEEEERLHGLSSFSNSLYYDCKRFEVELVRAYFRFGFMSEAEFKYRLTILKRYI